MTSEEFLAMPDEREVELISGSVVERAAPDARHGNAQFGLGAELRSSFQSRRRGGPGGWWILGEVDIQLGHHDVYRPDLVGWRRERIPELPRERPVTLCPDWVCEVVSQSNRRNDTLLKLRRYHQFGVPHYWIIDPTDETLTVYRHSPDGYTAILAAGRGDRVRAEPFDAVELDVGILFGDEPEEPAP